MTCDQNQKCDNNLLCGINSAKDVNSMTDLEKKHTPVITAPSSAKKGECFEVTVEVGKLLAHPNEPGHHIEFVDLYADCTYLARMSFTGGTTCPTMKVCVALDHVHANLRALAYCNLHGNWMGEAPIEVK